MWRHRSCGRASIEHETELADLDLVAGLEGGLFDPLPVDVRAVQGADVVDNEVITLATEGCVGAGHGDVVQEYVAVRVATRADLVGVKQDSGPRVGPA